MKKTNEINLPIVPDGTRMNAHKIIDNYYDNLEGKIPPFGKERVWLKNHWNGCFLGLVGAGVISVGFFHPALSIQSLAPTFIGCMIIIIGLLLDIWGRE